MLETVSVVECARCGHRWLPRQLGKPAVCPQCGVRRFERAAKPDTKYLRGDAWRKAHGAREG